MCLVCFCLTIVIAFKYLTRNSSNRLNQTIKSLYESGKKGRVTFIPGSSYNIKLSAPKENSQSYPIIQKKSAVTYGLSGGRLGDNLLSYLHARWIAYCNHLPLIIKHFPMDEEFALAYEDAPLLKEPIIEIPYFPEPSMKNNNPPFFVDWDDEGFLNEIARCLKPTKQHSLLELPKDRITICVHVRRGGTVDPPSLYYEYPLKFPPDQFFIDQIRTCAYIFKDKPLYVFLMTDDLHPEKIIDRYKKAVSCSNIQWDCRKKPAENILDDFYSIPLFDCLILGDSNFSIVASKLTQYAIRISPTHYKKKKGVVKITGLDIAFNPKYQKIDWKKSEGTELP